MNSLSRLTLLALLLCHPALAEPLHIVSEAWPPYIYEQNGELRGIDYDVSEKVLQQLGYNTRWQLMPWRRALHDTTQGAADAILDISPTPQRLHDLIFAQEPLSHSESVLSIAMIARIPSPGCRTCADSASAFPPGIFTATPSSCARITSAESPLPPQKPA
jgi:hypothetical protein